MKDDDEKTPLHKAALSNSPDMVKFLVSKGCELTQKDKYSNTILHIASQNGKLTLVKHLVETILIYFC